MLKNWSKLFTDISTKGRGSTAFSLSRFFLTLYTPEPKSEPNFSLNVRTVSTSRGLDIPTRNNECAFLN